LRWAADEAGRVHGELRIIRSWERPVRAYYAPPPPHEQRLTQEQATRDLAATVRTVLEPELPAGTTTEVAEGMAERVLVDQSAGASLLVLGEASGVMAGRSAGPVIRTCLSRAHCPVVVVSSQNFPCRDEAAASCEPAAGFDDEVLAAIGVVPSPRARD
jgi:nucleotide-binding universal stress UspA family protein